MEMESQAEEHGEEEIEEPTAISKRQITPKKDQPPVIAIIEKEKLPNDTDEKKLRSSSKKGQAVRNLHLRTPSPKQEIDIVIKQPDL
jgi:hypothetical protein